MLLRSESGTRGIRRSTARAAVVLVVVVGSQGLPHAPVAHADPTVSWISWDSPAEPGSYGITASGPGGIGDYTYVGIAEGSIVMPDTSTVYVRLTGEVVDPLTAPASWSSVDTAYGLPSGFAADVAAHSEQTTKSNYWDGTQIAWTDADTFTESDNVPSVPTSGDHIGLVGTGVAQQTLEFFSDSDRTIPVEVTNIVMLVNSLGNTTRDGRWDFSQDFTVLSDNEGVNAAGGGTGTTSAGLTKSIVGTSYRVTGAEGAGALQLNGDFDSFTFEVGEPEFWAAWNIGVTSALAPSGAAASLAIATQPTGGATSGSPLPTQPVVRILDASSNTVTGDSTTTVTATIHSGANGTLGGTTTVTAVNGVATFSGLTLSGDEGVDYVLRFTSTPALTAVDATAVQVTAAPAEPDAPAAPAAAPNTSCTPTEVRPGGSVACSITGAPSGATILWRAAVGSPVASGAVEIGPEGAGAFTVTLPDQVEARTLTVELVAWDVPRVVGTVAGAVPTAVPAGEVSGAEERLPWVGALMLLGLAVGLRGLARGALERS